MALRASSPLPALFGPDEWMRRLSALPLTAQPGEQWQYHTASDALGVLIARAAGQSFETFLAERIFGPLGMADTGFFVAPEKLGRLATAYVRDKAGTLSVFDAATDGAWSKPPVFAGGGGGLASTADDILAFGRMMRSRGRLGPDRVLSRPSVELMTRDHLTDAQKAASPFFPGFWEANGWGFGMSVTTRRLGLADSVGSYGWNGGLGTCWRNDPVEDMTCVFLVQRLMGGPSDTRITDDFMTLAYQAIDD